MRRLDVIGQFLERGTMGVSSGVKSDRLIPFRCISCVPHRRHLFHASLGLEATFGTIRAFLNGDVFSTSNITSLAEHEGRVRVHR